MARSFYQWLYPTIIRWQVGIVTVIGIVVIVAILLLKGISLDMSFRPFFADDDEAAGETKAFENVFGQRSGAYIGVIIEADNIVTPDFIRRLSLLSAEVEALPHVVEVRSLARLAAPVWDRDGIHGEWVHDPERLSQPGFPELMLSVLTHDRRLRRALLSEDARKTLLLARLDLPLQDLGGRKRVIEQFRTTVERSVDEPTHFVGVSVVEAAYSRIVLLSLARSLILTIIALVAVLWLLFRRPAAVLIAMAGISLATPVTLGAMTLIGQQLTMINSMVPIVVLIIGVADAIHMQQSFLMAWPVVRSKPDAIHVMFDRMALPCLLTTVTTAAGFLALRVAHIQAIRDFGLNVCIGVWVVYAFNLLLIPILLSRTPERWLSIPPGDSSWLQRWLRWSGDVVVLHGRVVIAVFAVLVVAGVWTVPRLRLDQRFNEEVAAGHPLRVAQKLLETEFSGFLGPEIRLRSIDGSSLVSAPAQERVKAFRDAVVRLDGVTSVETFVDFVPGGIARGDVENGFRALRGDPMLGYRMRELINADLNQAAVVVRIEDIGTRRSDALVDTLRSLARVQLGSTFETEIVGQWWLAHRGMKHIVHDMVFSFVTSALLVLPLLWLVLRSTRLFLVCIVPNILPMLGALAFAAVVGIPMRIGTAMILAAALGIAIDDTIHFMVRLKSELAAGRGQEDAVRETLRETGTGILYTSVVLVLGFLSMCANDLLVIRDMGLVASTALTIALLADVYLAPALYLATAGVARRSVDAHSSLGRGETTRRASDRARTETPAANRSRPSTVAIRADRTAG